jgi:hypothetical protein
MRRAWLFHTLFRLLPERSAMPEFCHKLPQRWSSWQGRSINAFQRSPWRSLTLR